MAAVSSEMTFFTLPNCFELFGFDLMADEEWNVWLLEVSHLVFNMLCIPHIEYQDSLLVKISCSP